MKNDIPQHEVMVTRSPSQMFRSLTMSFMSHGVPELVKHTSGPPYHTQQWRNYVTQWGFRDEVLTTPHPQVTLRID